MLRLKSFEEVKRRLELNEELVGSSYL